MSSWASLILQYSVFFFQIRLMRLLNKHPNIISLCNLWSRDEDNELYITMELMDSDLHQIIQSKQSLSEPHHQCLMKQVLLGVQAMHKLGVLHRDLKPGNLLVTRDCQLRITDFGLARTWNDSPSDPNEGQVGVMTEYVVTRWYRCPELLLAPHIPYNGAIDLWSVGCIFGELLNRRPLFPGKSYVHQVQVILDVLGTPSPLGEAAPGDTTNSKALGFKPRNDAEAFLKRQRHRNGVPWSQLLPAASEKAQAFLGSLLTWDPKRRLTVEEALAHPWLENAPPLPCNSCSLEELEASRPSDLDFKFEDPTTPLPVLKNLIYKEIEIFTGAAKAEAQAAFQGDAMAGRATSPSSFGPRPGTGGSTHSQLMKQQSLGSTNRPASPTPSMKVQATVAGAIGMAQKSVPSSSGSDGSCSDVNRSVPMSSSTAAAVGGSENISRSGNMANGQLMKPRANQNTSSAGASRKSGFGGGSGVGSLVRRQASRNSSSRSGVGLNGGAVGAMYRGMRAAGGRDAASDLSKQASVLKQQMRSTDKRYNASLGYGSGTRARASDTIIASSASTRRLQASMVSSGSRQQQRRSLPSIQNGIATLADSAASKQLFTSSSARTSNGSVVNDPLRVVRRMTSGGGSSR